LREFAIGAHTRTVTKDTVLNGCSLKKGDVIFMSYPIINRDPRVTGFDEVKLDRKPNRHLAFNQGWRQRIGLHFARRAL